MLINEVTNNTLDPQEDVVLLDFYASWCQPCKMLSKILEDLESDVPVYKVNIEENMDLAKKFNVRGVPHLVLFKDENAVATKTGLVSEGELLAFIETNR